MSVVACGQPERARAVVSAFIEGQREDSEVGDSIERALAELKDMIAELLRRGGVEQLSSARVLQIVVGAAVTERHPTAPVAAVADLLRLAER